jgi:hypothetical protein
MELVFDISLIFFRDLNIKACQLILENEYLTVS